LNHTPILSNEYNRPNTAMSHSSILKRKNQSKRVKSSQKLRADDSFKK